MKNHEILVRPVVDPQVARACAAMMMTTPPWTTFGLSEGGPLNGYINLLCVREDCRGRGLGAALIAWAEEKIFAQSPNAFICASSSGARRLYERLGYRLVGVLKDYVAAGHDEVLLRKTRGSWKAFRDTRSK